MSFSTAYELYQKPDDPAVEKERLRGYVTRINATYCAIPLFKSVEGSVPLLESNAQSSRYNRAMHKSSGVSWLSYTLAILALQSSTATTRRRRRHQSTHIQKNPENKSNHNVFHSLLHERGRKTLRPAHS